MFLAYSVIEISTDNIDRKSEVFFLYQNRSIISVNEKLEKFPYFGKYKILLDGYFYIHVSGQLQTGLEKLNSSASPTTMVHVMHMPFVLFVVFENSKHHFHKSTNLPVHASEIFIENSTKMV